MGELLRLTDAIGAAATLPGIYGAALGRGATFTVRLPRADAAAQPTTAAGA